MLSRITAVLSVRYFRAQPPLPLSARSRLALWLVALACSALPATTSAAGPFVYVVNTGYPTYTDNSLFPASVSQYDASGGALSPLSPAMVTFDGAGPMIGSVAVSPDAKSVYVSGLPWGIRFGAGNPGRIFQYDVRADGTLSPKTPATVAPRSIPGARIGMGTMVVSPDGKSAYVVDDVVSCVHFPGCVQSSPPPPFGPEVAQYDIGPNGGLTPKNPPSVPMHLEPGAVDSIAISPNGKNVYVTSYLNYPSDTGVSQFRVDAHGKLSPLNPPSVASGPYPGAIVVSPDSKSVYTVNSGVDQVSQYDVGPDGALTPKDPHAVAAGRAVYSIAVSSNGKNAYVTSDVDGVSQYDVGTGGELIPKTPRDQACCAEGVALSPDGKSLYATNEQGVTVSQYNVGPDGALTFKNPFSVQTGRSPGDIAVTPTPHVPTAVGQCKSGGWRDFPQFKNQGECVASVEHSVSRAQ
jgi:6-phosphogluconolactonase (cycloisomerase 2 family)